MTLINRWAWLPLLAAVWHLSPGNAHGSVIGVRDFVGLFGKPDVLEDIDRQIGHLHRRYGLDFFIETFAAVPADREQELKQLKASKFFPLWAEERALAAGIVDGIYILICTAPRHVEVYVSGSAQNVFDSRTRDRLRKTLERKLASKPNEGLQETLDLVSERLARSESEAKTGGWAWAVWGMGGIVGVWLLVAVVRRFRSGRTVPPPHVVSAGALSGESVYRAIADKPAASPEVSPQAATLPYPAPAAPHSEGTVHG